jgi:hypothetical protein
VGNPAFSELQQYSIHSSSTASISRVSKHLILTKQQLLASTLTSFAYTLSSVQRGKQKLKQIHNYTTQSNLLLYNPAVVFISRMFNSSNTISRLSLQPYLNTQTPKRPTDPGTRTISFSMSTVVFVPGGKQPEREVNP